MPQQPHRQISCTSSSTLSTPPGTYIYDLVPLTTSGSTTTQLAATSSTDSIHIFSASTLQIISTIPGVHKNGGVTGLKRVNGNVLATSGRDGVVRLWDARSTGEREVGKFKSREKPFLSLDVSEEYNAIAAGEELADHEASVVIWDMRNSSSISRHYTESHNDDVTCLQFDPLNTSLLLSGSTDGLVSIYDLSKTKLSAKDSTDDDEALFQVINHGSSIHRAGFMPIHCAPQKTEMDVFALSHDETLGVYPLNDRTAPAGEGSEQEAEEDGKTVFGDIREKFNCSYALNLIPSSHSSQTTTTPGGTLIIGSHTEEQPSQQWIDLLPFDFDFEHSSSSVIDGEKGSAKRSGGWKVNVENGIRLLGGHGEEVVRCVHVSAQERTVWTGGEDGVVKVWRVSEVTGGEDMEGESMVLDGDDDQEGDEQEEVGDKKKEQKTGRLKAEKEPGKKKKKKKKYSGKDRIKPY